MKRLERQCVICEGQFNGGEIEPGTFHGGEIEPGTFHVYNDQDNYSESVNAVSSDGDKPEYDSDVEDLAASIDSDDISIS